MSRNHGKNPAMRMEAKQMMGRSPRGGTPSSSATTARAREEMAAEQEGQESPPSSCVSWEEGVKNDDSPPPPPPSSSSMVLAGCPHCLIYVMISDKDTKCPRCNTALLLDLAAASESRTKNI